MIEQVQAILSALPVGIGILAPGIAMLGAEKRFAPCAELSSQDRLIRYGVYSLAFYAIYVVIFGPSSIPSGDWTLAATLPFALRAFGALCLAILLAGGIGILRRFDTIGRVVRSLGAPMLPGYENAWVKSMLRNEGLLARCVLTDGTELFGTYGQDSVAAIGVKNPDLFLEREWVETRNGLEQVIGSEGFWVSQSRIVSIRFYSISELDSDEAKQMLNGQVGQVGQVSEERLVAERDVFQDGLAVQAGAQALGADCKPQESRQVIPNGAH